MLIGNKWKIEADDLQVVLYIKHVGGRIPKTGLISTKEIWVVHSYYSNVKNALKALTEQEIRGTNLKDLKTVVEKIDELHALIDGLNVARDM
jgi:hypothetical protein